MKKMFELIADAQNRGQDTVLASIIGDSGSAPRGPGAHMLIDTGGRVYGTVGGGAVEYNSLQIAAEGLRQGRSRIHSFHLNRNDVEDIGMICGGNVTIYFQYIAAADQRIARLCQAASSLLSQDIDVWMICQFADDESSVTGLFSEESGLLGIDADAESLKPFLGHEARRFELAGRRYYGEPINRSGRMLIFGGGHVSQELAPLLAHLGFRCLVIDDRPEFTDPALFPGVSRTICHDFEDIDSFLHIRPEDYIVIMTRGHAHDYSLQLQALRHETAYVGVIGSRMKIKLTTEKLLKDGIQQERIDAVHWPIGLDILAETPAEIAVSVAAELIEARARRSGK